MGMRGADMRFAEERILLAPRALPQLLGNMMLCIVLIITIALAGI